MKSWTAVIVTVAPELAESVSGFLLDAGAPGLETLEGDGEQYLVAHFAIPPSQADLGKFFETLGEIFPGAPRPVVRIQQISDDTWTETWKEHFPPIEVGARLFVHPPWVTDVPNDRVGIVIDPGMAFGTGHHQSTHGCLLMLEEAAAARPNARVLDIGTGSGILAIAAAKLGAREVWATDNDPDACPIAEDNTRVNEVAEHVHVTGELDECIGPFDVVVVNILARPLIDLAPRIAAFLAPDGVAIGSGITADEEPAVAEAWKAAGMEPLSNHRDGEWVTIAFRHRR
jgi:ribosomal protein L11 methyltransferase